MRLKGVRRDHKGLHTATSRERLADFVLRLVGWLVGWLVDEMIALKQCTGWNNS